MDELTTAATGEVYEAAYNAGQNQTQDGKIADVPYFVIPKNMKVETLQELASNLREKPLFLQQDVETLSAQSFIEYFNRYATKNSSVFFNTEHGRFKAVLDYHEGVGQPDNKNHTLTYLCPKTKEWNAWKENNNTKMSQEDFALFIEDNLPEIAKPAPAEMLEIASNLKAKNSVDFKSASRLDNGEVQFMYSETIDGHAGVSGQLEIPEKIELNIRPFQNGAPYKLEARFRYRITQSGLLMWYTLIRPHTVHDHAVEEVLQAIKEGVTTEHVYAALTNV